MGVARWVYCRFCQQTYAAGHGERCSLCGKHDGLLDSPAPLRADSDRASWTPSAGTEGGTSLAAGCLCTLMGAALGIAIVSLSVWEPQAVQAGDVAAALNQGCGLSWIPALFDRFILGAGLGAVGGALVGAFAAAALSWMSSRAR